MLKPTNKQELLDLIKSKTFKIVLVEEDQAKTIGDKIKKMGSKKVTVVVLE